MKCLVTGGAGFIGSNLVDRLIDDGHEVVIIDNLSTGQKENINPKAIWNNMDIGLSSAPPYLETTMKGVDVVFHLAAKARVQSSIENPIEFHNTNVNGTLNLLVAAGNAGVSKFVFSSSSSVYGDVDKKYLPVSEEMKLNPMSPYAVHKLIGEQYCKLFSKLYGIQTACLRYFNVYGERQTTEGAYCLVMGIFAKQLLDGKPMTINGDGEQRRDFTYVGDVVEANIKIAFSDKNWNGNIFNVGNGDNRSINQLADMIGDDSDRVYNDPVIEPTEGLADNSKLRSELDWKPTVKLEDWVIKYKKDLGL